MPVSMICGCTVSALAANFGSLVAKAKLVMADLSYSDLRGCNFTLADVSGCVFRGANLEGADFTGAIMRPVTIDVGKDVTWPTNFQRAVLRLADLRSTQIERAIFRGCDLTESKLSLSMLKGSDLTGARLPAGITDEKVEGLKTWGKDAKATVAGAAPPEAPAAAPAAAPAVAPAAEEPKRSRIDEIKGDLWRRDQPRKKL